VPLRDATPVHPPGQSPWIPLWERGTRKNAEGLRPSAGPAGLRRGCRVADPTHGDALINWPAEAPAPSRSTAALGEHSRGIDPFNRRQFPGPETIESQKPLHHDLNDEFRGKGVVAAEEDLGRIGVDDPVAC